MKTIFLLALSLTLGFSAVSNAQQRNLLLIIADDYGIDSASLYNSSPGAVLPPTPNINALKSSGVMFRTCYALPTCSPARATMLTGRQPFRHGVTTAVTADDGQLMAGEFTLPRAFAANPILGYSTACLGKWHLSIGPTATIQNDPANLAGWSHCAGSLSGAFGTGTYTSWTKTINGVTGVTNGTTTYATTDTTNDALSWIAARGAAPWFLWLGYNAPHTPFHKPPDNLHTYDTTIAGWATLPINNNATNQRLHFNAAMEALDTEIGRLLSSMAPGVRANTTIIFVGDNGTPNQVIQTPFSTGHAKDSIYEGGTRVPLIISGPDVVSPDRESTVPVNVADLYATILELAGINVAATQPVSKPIDSQSLLPVLKNLSDPAPRYGYAEQSGSTLSAAESGKAVRNEAGYKLIRFNDAHEEFYFIPTDVNEQTNLSRSVAPASFDELSALLNGSIALANSIGAPVETQWQKMTGAEYARIYRTQAAALAGNSVTTWVPSGAVLNGTQASPVYAGLESIRVSANWVYVKGSGLPHYTMGPWYFDAAKTQIFVNYPNKWEMLTRLPRLPVPAVTRSNTNFGPIAIWVNSTIIHNQLDAFYWTGTSDVDTNANGLESWTRNARMAEGLTFDPAGAHQPFTGESHHHINPMALRYELGDHVNYNATTHSYTEAEELLLHSPILGWSFDGFPIYGPYGYSTADNPASGVRRMKSGYVARDGAFGTTDLNTAGRAALPAWAVRAGHGTAPRGSATGPAISSSYPLGWYLQDFDYLGDHGYVQGVTFDLDECNGRWCVTPEFPLGTYAYFVTIGADNSPAFPYIIGRQYFGVKQGGNIGGASTVGFSSLELPNITLYQGGVQASLSIDSFTKNGGQVALTWSSVEGGRYTVESSPNLSNWTDIDTNIPGAARSTLRNESAVGNSRFYRVRRDSVDAYDPVNTP